MKNKAIFAASLMLGVVNVLVFKLFEWSVNAGTNLIWYDLFNTKDNRWLVVPLATVLSVGLSWLFLQTKQQRVDKPKVNSLEAERSKRPITLKETTLFGILGLASLVAGASLGPEASLMLVSTGLGSWFATKFKQSDSAQLLILGSIGALLVVFCGSIIPIFMPLLLLVQKKQLSFFTGAVIATASVSAYAIDWLIEPAIVGFAQIPWEVSINATDLLISAVVGVGAVVLGWLLRQLTLRTYSIIKRFNERSWLVSAALFGIVLGILYLLGGETIQFSGNEGTAQLLTQADSYSIGLLITLLATKLLATAWSLASGYRGGLVFPSIFIGVALALIAERLLGVSSGGILIGAVAGVFSAMTGAAVGLIFMLSILPIKFAGVILAGTIGATIGAKILNMLLPSKFHLS